MPELNGLELQRALAKSGRAEELVFITGGPSVPTCVQAMKAGAIEFLAKPFPKEDLLAAIRRGLELDDTQRGQQAERSSLQARFEQLSPREREVMDLLVTGSRSQEVAAALHISVRTVEVHRRTVFWKMDVSSAAELVGAVLRVRDSGIGISAELLPRVFDLFSQGERSLDRSLGGLGVGLTVVRRLVELHQGRVEVASDGPGKGARFSIVLPCISEVPQESASKQVSYQEGIAAEGRRILVVDDNVDAAESIAVLLRMEGHEVKTVTDGRQALACSQVVSPSAVVLDIGLPGMNGYEVARRLREMPETRRALFIALTGYGQREDRVLAADAGFHHHFIKPADPRAIHAVISAFEKGSEQFISNEGV
jgi:FixJ family two-component response regulator